VDRLEAAPISGTPSRSRAPDSASATQRSARLPTEGGQQRVGAFPLDDAVQRLGVSGSM
jgi:hypothetical protein